MHEELEKVAYRILNALAERAELDMKFGGDGDEGQALVDAFVDLAAEGLIQVVPSTGNGTTAIFLSKDFPG